MKLKAPTWTYRGPDQSYFDVPDDFTKIPNILIRTKYLSLSAFRLFCYLASFKRAFPSYKRIREDLGFSKATIAKAIAELVLKEIVSYHQGHSRYKANEYLIHHFRNWRLNIHCPDRTEPFRRYCRRYRKNHSESSESELVQKLYDVGSDCEQESTSEFEPPEVQEPDSNKTYYQDQSVEDGEEKTRVATASQSPMTDSNIKHLSSSRRKA